MEEKTLAVVWRSAPASQKFSLKVTPEPGKMMGAREIGKKLEAFARILEMPHPGDDYKWRAGVARITMDDEGAIQFDVVVAVKKP